MAKKKKFNIPPQYATETKDSMLQKAKKKRKGKK